MISLVTLMVRLSIALVIEIARAARALGHLIAEIYRAVVVGGINWWRRRNGHPELSSRQLVRLRIGSVAVAGVAILVVGSIGENRTGSPRTVAAPGASSSASINGSGARGQLQPAVEDRSATGPSSAPAAPRFGTGPVPATVVRVTDGDTLELEGGEKVRVLGIDSCETDTPAGREAARAAQVFLSLPGGTALAPVTLTSEPGVDKDQYGRWLRYVTTYGGDDLGLLMVRYDHTGVYQGSNDAADAYVQALYGSDLMYATEPPAGRLCGEDPPPVPAPLAVPDVPDLPGDGSSYVERKAKGKAKGYVCRKTIFC